MRWENQLFSWKIIGMEFMLTFVKFQILEITNERLNGKCKFTKLRWLIGKVFTWNGPGWGRKPRKPWLPVLIQPQNCSRTFDPIWLPHWPTCKCTISLMMIATSPNDYTIEAKILIWLKVDVRVYGLMWTTKAPAITLTVLTGLRSRSSAIFPILVNENISLRSKR